MRVKNRNLNIGLLAVTTVTLLLPTMVLASYHYLRVSWLSLGSNKTQQPSRAHKKKTVQALHAQDQKTTNIKHP